MLNLSIIPPHNARNIMLWTRLATSTPIIWTVTRYAGVWRTIIRFRAVRTPTNIYTTNAQTTIPTIKNASATASSDTLRLTVTANIIWPEALVPTTVLRPRNIRNVYVRRRAAKPAVRVQLHVRTDAAEHVPAVHPARLPQHLRQLLPEVVAAAVAAVAAAEVPAVAAAVPARGISGLPASLKATIFAGRVMPATAGVRVCTPGLKMPIRPVLTPIPAKLCIPVPNQVTEQADAMKPWRIAGLIQAMPPHMVLTVRERPVRIRTPVVLIRDGLLIIAIIPPKQTSAVFLIPDIGLPPVLLPLPIKNFVLYLPVKEYF